MPIRVKRLTENHLLAPTLRCVSGSFRTRPQKTAPEDPQPALVICAREAQIVCRRFFNSDENWWSQSVTLRRRKLASLAVPTLVGPKLFSDVGNELPAGLPVLTISDSAIPPKQKRRRKQGDFRDARHAGLITGQDTA